MKGSPSFWIHISNTNNIKSLLPTLLPSEQSELSIIILLGLDSSAKIESGINNLIHIDDYQELELLNKTFGLRLSSKLEKTVLLSLLYTPSCYTEESLITSTNYFATLIQQCEVNNISPFYKLYSFLITTYFHNALYPALQQSIINIDLENTNDKIWLSLPNLESVLCWADKTVKVNALFAWTPLNNTDINNNYNRGNNISQNNINTSDNNHNRNNDDTTNSLWSIFMEVEAGVKKKIYP